MQQRMEISARVRFYINSVGITDIRLIGLFKVFDRIKFKNHLDLSLTNGSID